MSGAAAAVKLLELNIMGTRERFWQLSSTLEALRIMHLYRKYFPKQFDCLRINWLKQGQVLDACGEFMQLVDMNLFPCHAPMVDEFEERPVNEMLLVAPWPAWWEGFDQGPLERLILESVGEIDAQGKNLHRLYSYTSTDPRPELNARSLKLLCARRPAPLKHLPTAVFFVLKVTGNVWCDLTDEEVCATSSWPKWNERNIKYFARQWTKAKEINGKFRHLEAWLEEDPENAKTIRGLIGKAMKRPRPRPACGPRTLCESLSDVLDREEIDHDDFE